MAAEGKGQCSTKIRIAYQDTKGHALKDADIFGISLIAEVQSDQESML